MFERPDMYTSPSDRWDFSHFDREYEREHMPQLIRTGWPVNWEYVHKANIGPIVGALVHRTLVHDTPKWVEQISTGFRELISWAKRQMGSIVDLIHWKKAWEDIPEEISWKDKESMAHV